MLCLPAAGCSGTFPEMNLTLGEVTYSKEQGLAAKAAELEVKPGGSVAFGAAAKPCAQPGEPGS
jgi:hypothetical protein